MEFDRYNPGMKLREAPRVMMPGSGRFCPYCSGMALPPIMLPRIADGLPFS